MESAPRFGVQHMIERRDRFVQIPDGVDDVIDPGDSTGMGDRLRG